MAMQKVSIVESADLQRLLWLYIDAAAPQQLDNELELLTRIVDALHQPAQQGNSLQATQQLLADACEGDSDGIPFERVQQAQRLLRAALKSEGLL